MGNYNFRSKLMKTRKGWQASMDGRKVKREVFLATMTDIWRWQLFMLIDLKSDLLS